ncbi:MAG: HD domain-containing protein [Tissierellaceae bacterium]|nr:HD domain-containing protein [Tissierellaceae bacterium]
MDIDNFQYVKLKLERFADQIDNKNQNILMTDLMIKYSELSKSFEEKNHLLLKNKEMLQKYNNRLEELVNEKVKEISESQIATIFALVKLAESRDDDTGAHIERTAQLCRLMAICLREHTKYKDLIDDEYIENIYKASPLHDIGKVGIPDSILLKKGKLTEEEFKIMKSHVEIGYETLKEVHNRYTGNSFLEMGMDITRNHHEKWDGSGYPRGLIGEEIPLSGRIMSIVDVYDALRSKRVYKEAYSHEKSKDIISRNKGTQFDPILVDIFLDNHTEFERIHEVIHIKPSKHIL